MSELQLVERFVPLSKHALKQDMFEPALVQAWRRETKYRRMPLAMFVANSGWVDMLGGKIYRDLSVRLVVGGRRREFFVNLQDDAWFEHLQADIAECLGVENVESQYAGVRLIDNNNNKLLTKDQETLETLANMRHYSVVADYAPVVDSVPPPLPPKPTYQIPYLLQPKHVLELAQKQATDSLQAPGMNLSAAVSDADLRRVVEELIRAFSERVMKALSVSLSKVEQPDYGSVRSMILRTLSSESQLAQSSAFWKASRCQNVGHAIGDLSSDIAARFCKIKLGASEQKQLSPELIKTSMINCSIWDEWSEKLRLWKYRKQNARVPLPCDTAAAAAGVVTDDILLVCNPIGAQLAQKVNSDLSFRACPYRVPDASPVGRRYLCEVPEDLLAVRGVECSRKKKHYYRHYGRCRQQQPALLTSTMVQPPIVVAAPAPACPAPAPAPAPVCGPHTTAVEVPLCETLEKSTQHHHHADGTCCDQETTKKTNASLLVSLPEMNLLQIGSGIQTRGKAWSRMMLEKKREKHHHELALRLSHLKHIDCPLDGCSDHAHLAEQFEKLPHVECSAAGCRRHQQHSHAAVVDVSHLPLIECGLDGCNKHQKICPDCSVGIIDATNNIQCSYCSSAAAAKKTNNNNNKTVKADDSAIVAVATTSATISTTQPQPQPLVCFVRVVSLGDNRNVAATIHHVEDDSKTVQSAVSEDYVPVKLSQTSATWTLKISAVAAAADGDAGTTVVVTSPNEYHTVFLNTENAAVPPVVIKDTRASELPPKDKSLLRVLHLDTRRKDAQVDVSIFTVVKGVGELLAENISQLPYGRNSKYNTVPVGPVHLRLTGAEKSTEYKLKPRNVYTAVIVPGGAMRLLLDDRLAALKAALASRFLAKAAAALPRTAKGVLFVPSNENYDRVEPLDINDYYAAGDAQKLLANVSKSLPDSDVEELKIETLSGKQYILFSHNLYLWAGQAKPQPASKDVLGGFYHPDIPALAVFVIDAVAADIDQV